MNDNFKRLRSICFVLAACYVPTAQAGFFDDLRAIFGGTPPPAETANTAAPAVIKDTPRSVSNPNTPQTGATINADAKQAPGPPTQKELNELLWLAALQGNFDRIRGLVEQGADPMSGTPHGETPMHVAASRGHLRPIIYLSNHGGSVNARTRNGWTPLHHAARFGHQDVVRYLLQKGAAPHIRTNDKGSKSPMEMAVDNNYIEIARLFGYRPR